MFPPDPSHRPDRLTKQPRVERLGDAELQRHVDELHPAAFLVVRRHALGLIQIVGRTQQVRELVRRRAGDGRRLVADVNGSDQLSAVARVLFTQKRAGPFHSFTASSALTLLAR